MFMLSASAANNCSGELSRQVLTEFRGLRLLHMTKPRFAPDTKEKQRIADYIPSPHSPRFLDQPPQPFQTDLAHPLWRARNFIRVEIKQSSNPDFHRRAEPPKIVCDPDVLSWRAEAHQQDIGL